MRTIFNYLIHKGLLSLFKKLDGSAVLVDINENKIRVESDPEKIYIDGNSYKIQENDGNLTI